ncbi:hypothetical protein [Xenorhabdus szentirmaii]|uniref:Uncharacterized protein n=1 Tax=Xenorhabdus szentirmaii TaxID=290112 RepID=A0AAW3YTN8_9GAMM|nr:MULTISPECIES: hypothetical protein [Xenorhabdus]MBD2792491.1 hypothetical protein [Xenorhabdus sp. CUL]MBD2801500.1 hypothetical protein [Xenorhabdus sp. M]MBD2805067.1 hypothetical protein [Xenorhabdus sp. ZM]MBD2826178.1 hypothetical protein [Xenorhabdus sp. 5]
MRYICAPLEADIVRHITHRLAMKVIRFLDSPAYHSRRAVFLPRSPLNLPLHDLHPRFD